MKILHTGDWHLGKNLDGYSRIEEQEMFLNDFVKIVKENEVDLVIIAGDVYDSSNPPARAEQLLYKSLKEITEGGKRLVLIIAGNHDNYERITSASPLAKSHGIIMVGTPKTIVETGEYGNHKIINSGEGFIEIEINNEKSVILTVPYPSEKRLNEVLYGDMDTEDMKLKSYSDRIHDLFYTLSKNFRDDTINLITSHLFVFKSEEGGSERSIQLGGSFIVNSTCFPKDADYIALGHVHKPQVVPGTNGIARYSGSPLHYNKREINFDKKCFLVDIKKGTETKITDIALKVYKPIEIWYCDSIEDAINKCDENKDKNSFVYIEVVTDRYIREDEIKIMRSLKKDIIEINPKIIGLNHIEDEVDISDKSFEELFKSFYEKERDTKPNENIVNLILSIIDEEY
ncbi:MAG: exonuclease SbcCD subunit D [Peptostreptococcaceae bacterium]